MSDLYEFDELYHGGKTKEWQEKLENIRQKYFYGIDLNPQ